MTGCLIPVCLVPDFDICVLHGFLGKIEVAENADKGGEDFARLFAKDGLDGGL